MNITGLEGLVFGVDDVAACAQYLTDYGLRPAGHGHGHRIGRRHGLRAGLSAQCAPPARPARRPVGWRARRR